MQLTCARVHLERIDEQTQRERCRAIVAMVSGSGLMDQSMSPEPSLNEKQIALRDAMWGKTSALAFVPARMIAAAVKQSDSKRASWSPVTRVAPEIRFCRVPRA